MVEVATAGVVVAVVEVVVVGPEVAARGVVHAAEVGARADVTEATRETTDQLEVLERRNGVFLTEVFNEF